MKLGVLTVPLASKSLEETLDYLSGLGVQCVELGAGGYTNPCHLDVQKVISDDAEVERIKALLDKYHMEISALSAHGNPLHPNKELAASYHKQFQDAVLAAERLGIDTVIGFSGCPGDCETSQYPNWVTCAWPDDYGKILEWQWEEKIIPYWKDMAAFCRQHDISKIAFEMQPGFAVYNVATLLRLRKAVGDCIGANFDPSHLIWQGTNPVEAIKALQGAMFHFHAKDTKVDAANTGINGVLDTGHYGNVLARSWVFRTVGYGSDEKLWKDMMSALAAIGYDGTVSIEHEDSLMSVTEGLEKAIRFMQNVMITEGPCEMWWA